MSWTKKQIVCLIEEFRKYPCLIANQKSSFRHIHSRIRALLKITSVMNKVKPNVTGSEIKKKFHDLKLNFLHEHRRVLEAQRKSESTMYKPSIWYYDSMKFVLEHCDIFDIFENISEEDSNTEMSFKDIFMNSNVEHGPTMNSSELDSDEHSFIDSIQMDRRKRRRRLFDESTVENNVDLDESGQSKEDPNHFQQLLGSILKKVKNEKKRLELEHKILDLAYSAVREDESV